MELISSIRWSNYNMKKIKVFTLFMVLISAITLAKNNSSAKEFLPLEINQKSLLLNFKKNIKNLNLQLSSQYKSKESTFNRYTKYSFLIGVNGDIQFTEKIKFYFDLSQKFENGNSISFSKATDNSPQNKLSNHHLYLNYDIFQNISIQAGSLDHTDPQLNSFFLNSKKSFLGIREIFILKWHNTLININMTQSAPYGNAISPGIEPIQRTNPRFFSKYINIKTQIKESILKIKLGYFSYSNLLSSTAYKGYYLGNTISNFSNEQRSSYQYSFQGYNFAFSFSFKLQKNLQIETDFKYLKNSNAPKRKNEGKILSIGLNKKFKKIKSKIKFEFFKNNSDSSPAHYRSPIYSNNSKGNLLSIEIQRINGLLLKFNFINKKSIHPYLLSSLTNTKIIYLSIGKEYAIL